MTKAKNESGRTMLEMLGVLAIMGVIMYGAIAGIGFGVDMYKITATFNDVEELSQGVIDLFSWNAGGYPETSFKQAIQGNDLVDLQICNSGASTSACFVSRFGSQINVTPCPARDCSKFEIAISGLPYLAVQRLKNMTYANMTVTSTDDGSLTLTSK